MKLHITHSEPLISRIIFNTDMMDTCAGAYPIDPDDRIMEQMAWVFAPYTDARSQGKIFHLNSIEMETIIDAVLDRISLYSIGHGQLQKPDIRYKSKTYRATTSGAEATTAADPLASAAALAVHRISPS